MPKREGDYKKFIQTAVIGLLTLTLGLTGWSYYSVSGSLQTTEAELKNTNTDLLDIQSRYNALKEERDYIYDNLLSEQAKNELFENQIKDIVGTVGRLDELSKTDKELLQKYSKIYFLNEHYIPGDLVDISPDYIYENGKKIQFHAKALRYLQRLLTDAKNAGFELKIISGYRSFGEQSALKNNYLVTYGSGANTFSADQGYSEHQLGTALDLTTKDLGVNFANFGKTDTYEWLRKNAHKYGFVLSYPEENNYYQFEPWHWRFVGKSLAAMLYEEKQSFYDLPQNKIDAYLIKIFD